MKTLIALITLITFPTYLFAQPIATYVKKGEICGMDGSLLNNEAVAKILSEKEYAKQKCELDKEYEKKKGDVDCKYLLDKQKLEKETMEKQLNSMLKIKDDEIGKLQNIVKKDNSKWWAIGGILSGIVSTLGVFYIIDKVK